MKITLKKRIDRTLTEIRRSEEIPAILYGKGHPNQKVIVQNKEFQTVLRSIKQGQLSTQIFDIDFDGSSLRVVIKEIQYDPATYAIDHLGLFILSDQEPIKVNIPIEVIGVADCPGIKLGGSLRQVLRTVPVSCLPREIPSTFQIDVRTMNLGEAKRVSDLTLPANVRPLIDPNEVLIVIAKAKAAAAAT